MKLTRGSSSVMARRREPPDSLDYFPTPPWATRALCEHVLPRLVDRKPRQLLDLVWEPACGAGHMAEPLREYAQAVHASDVFDYGYGVEFDFLGAMDDFPDHFDWIITNPPFKTSLDFAERAVQLARVGVALLVRTQWIEGGDRYARLFAKTPPDAIAFFVERVPMVKGRWDPAAASATSYAWFVWQHRPNSPIAAPSVMWIPPGCRKALTTTADLKRFGGLADAPLLTNG